MPEEMSTQRNCAINKICSCFLQESEGMNTLMKKKGKKIKVKRLVYLYINISDDRAHYMQVHEHTTDIYKVDVDIKILICLLICLV